MNHQPFEEWLFVDPERSGQDLEDPERAALEEHLSGCEVCRQLAEAWAGVDAELRSAPRQGPQPGFTARWQARLELERQRLERRQSLAVLLFTLSAAILLFGTLAILALPMLQTPALLLVTIISRLQSWLGFIVAAREGFTALLVAAGNLPVLGWVLLAGVICQAAVIWFVSLRYFTDPKRVNK